MLQFADNPYRYFPPKPNRLIAWLGEQWNGRCHLPGTRHLISNVEVENAGPLLEIHRRHGARVLLMPNHSTHSDPQIMVETCRQIKLWSFFMAAYDVFERDAKVAWVMQRMGAFSVDRDGSDRQSLKEAVRSVIDGRYALTIFPEGNVYFMNDRVTPFLDGPAYIAMKAQQELKEGGCIFAVPVSIKVSHVTDVRPRLREMLAAMAAVLDVEIDSDGDIVVEVHRVGIAMVERNLKMRGFLPLNPDYNDLPGLLRASTELILEKLEHKIGITPKAGADLMDRIRGARREIHKVRTSAAREIDHSVAATWADEAILAFRILSYAGNYLSENPTLDRVGETIEKMREDLYSRDFPPYGERIARVRLGEPIDVSEQLAAAAKPREAMAGLTVDFEKGVQAGLDELNATNPHPGGELF
ncbi:MAG: 1-acyl-sn-glycerol-3-phosphate acyltransferase [Verrucomicrobia subdivision 3 bacterium]|nr:1-acyl-sn-glycerol-3-phosphate acyltransferase [Limisphaerales bacterium]